MTHFRRAPFLPPVGRSVLIQMSRGSVQAVFHKLRSTPKYLHSNLLHRIRYWTASEDVNLVKKKESVKGYTCQHHHLLLFYHMLYEILNYGCCWHSRGHLFPVFTSCTLVLRTASHRSAAWHSPCHRWTLAQELLIKEHVRTAPSCHPCESQHLQPSRTLLNAAVLMKGA